MMDEMMKITDVDTIMQVPPEIAVCPICGHRLVITEFGGHEQCDDGLRKAVEITLECGTGPDIDSAEWDDWFAGHYSMPYVDWLPVHQRILAWLEKHYRFDLDGKFTTKDMKGHEDDN